MIQPIVLDQFGATLVPFEERKTNTFPFYLGTHLGCTGAHCTDDVHVQYHSESHNCLLCKGCLLRIVVPNDKLPLVVTLEIYEPLREWLAQRIRYDTEMHGHIEAIVARYFNIPT